MASLLLQINQTISNKENNTTEESAIVQLAKCVDIKKLSELVTAGNANTSIDDKNNTLLHLATANKNLTLIKYLLEDFSKSDAERKQMLEKQNNSGETSFFIANELEITKYYLETMKVDVLQTNNRKQNILHDIKGENEIEKLTYILETCVYTKDKCNELLNQEDNLGNTPFLGALAYKSESGRLEVIEYYIEKHKVDIFQTNDEHKTILHLASESAKDGPEMIEYLVEQCETKAKKKEFLKMRDFLGNTPFLCAGCNGGIWNNIGYYIEELKINIAQVNAKNETILHRIADFDRSKDGFQKCAHECTGYILHQEHNKQFYILLGIENREGNTPCFDAVVKNNLELVRLYLDRHHVSILKKNIKGQTALHLACISNNVDMAKYLIEEAAKTDDQRKSMLEVTDVTGLNPFITSGLYGNTKILRYFIEDLKVDINQHCPKNTTAFLQCAFNGHLKATQYLLSKGAALSTSTYAGMATNKNIKYSEEFLNLLSAADELVAYANGLKTRPLSQLLKEGASLNQVFQIDKYLSKPLHLAAGKGNDKAVEEILEVDVNLSYSVDYLYKVARFAEKNGFMSVVARSLMHEIKIIMLQNANNEEFLIKNEKEITAKIDRIFTAAGKVKDVNLRSALYLNLGKKFNEIHLLEQAKRAFESIDCNNHSKEYRDAQAELMAFPIVHDSNILSLEASNMIDVKTEKEDFGQKMLLLNALKLGYNAGLTPTHAQKVSALRMCYLNNLFCVSMDAPKMTAAAAIAHPYLDPCRPDGLMLLTKKHFLALKKNCLLSEKNKKHQQENEALQSELDKLKAQNQTLVKVLDQALPSKKRKLVEEMPEHEKEKNEKEKNEEFINEELGPVKRARKN